MNKFNFQAMTKHGFLIIPKTLLQQQIENPHLQEGEIEALLKILCLLYTSPSPRDTR